MYYISFANKYYTLWLFNYIYNQKTGEPEFRSYTFVKNISMNLDKVKELYPGVSFDFSLKGTKRVFKEYIKPEGDKFGFGKYCGLKIEESTDYNYIKWYMDQAISESQKNICENVLLKNGYVKFNDRLITEEEYRIIENHYKTVMSYNDELEEKGYIEITFNNNLDKCSDTYNYLDRYFDITFDEGKEMYYCGYYYYLPVFNGKAKRIKNKTFRVYAEKFELNENTQRIEIKCNKLEVIK